MISAIGKGGNPDVMAGVTQVSFSQGALDFHQRTEVRLKFPIYHTSL